MKQRVLLSVVCLLIVGGCGGSTPRLPAPVEDRSQGESVVQPIRPERPAAAAESLPAASSGEVSTPRAMNRATVALLQQAQAQAHAGDQELAAATLERAIRIEPADPWPWQRLAALRLQQRMLRQAIDIAHKSNSLAVDDVRVVAGNWEVIARAKDAQGDAAGAAAAWREHARYQQLITD